MREPQLARGGQDAARAQRVGGAGRVGVAELRERGGMADERAVADDRGRAGELLRRRREPAESRPHRRHHALGRGDEDVAGALGSGLAQRAAELAQEERVAAGQLMACAAQRGEGVRDGGAHELGRRVLAERLRAQQRAVRQRLGDGGAAGLAERSCGDHEQDRHLREPVAEIGHEPQ